MNILYILGNGFDKAQGMATSYPEFYKYLTENVKDGSALLNQMKSEITENVELWSDMESGLGKFTSATDNAVEFDNFYFELSEHLQNYLKIQNDKFTPDSKFKHKFNDDFVNCEKYLGSLDIGRYNEFIKRHSFVSKDIYAMTLNYTNTLEKILDNNPSTGIFTKNLSLHNNLQRVIHVHGQLDSTIIIGVDNADQINHAEFRNNEDIKDCLIKMQANQAMKETRHIQCEKLITDANVIILMGVSLGDTDAHWWELIGNNLVGRKDLVIIQHLYNPAAVNPTQMQKRGRLERRQQELIMQKMRIEDSDWTDELRERLFFTVNAPIFKM